jgi:glycosyltransferase involved in cell wall biosynthesis
VGTPLSIAVCSNRPQNLAGVSLLLDSTAEDDEILLVVDLEPGPEMAEQLTDLAARGVRVSINGCNRGLAYSRNRALAQCRHQYLVYVDDDAVVPPETIEAIRDTVGDGAGIVGVWLAPRFQSRLPWWLTGGQYHYLGVHHTVELATTWGACMALDARLARQAGLQFRTELGRHGKALLSGEDTTFLAELRRAGAIERFLTGSAASHYVSADRTRLAYLLRRAWWQGRSEMRRSAARTSLSKEWRRAVATGPASTAPARRYLLAVLYVAAVASGIVVEYATQAVSAGRGQL